MKRYGLATGLSSRWLLALVGSALLATGCGASKAIHHPGLVTNWDKQAALPANTEAPPIRVVLHTERILYGRPSPSWWATWVTRRKIERGCDTALAQFPLLARAQRDLKDAPYRLVIEATHTLHRGDVGKAILSSLSLFLIPYTHEMSLELKARFYRGTASLNTYHATGHQPFRIHFFSWPVSIFRPSLPARTIQDTFSDLFLQLQQDAGGLFTTQEEGLHGS